MLKLDVRYLARIGVPLFRITRQRDGVSALGELVTFLGYVVRLLLGLHIWSFRAPDKDTDPANDVLNLLAATHACPSGRRLRRCGDRIPIAIAPEAPEGGDGKAQLLARCCSRVTRIPTPPNGRS